MLARELCLVRSGANTLRPEQSSFQQSENSPREVFRVKALRPFFEKLSTNIWLFKTSGPTERKERLFRCFPVCTWYLFYRDPPSLSRPSQEKWYGSITPHREFYISSYQARVSFEFLFISNAVVRWSLQLLNYRDLQLKNLRKPCAVNQYPSGQVNDRKEKDMIISNQRFLWRNMHKVYYSISQVIFKKMMQNLSTPTFLFHTVFIVT